MSAPQFHVFSDATREWALPERAGWTRNRFEAGAYDASRADKAAQTMLDGQRHRISLVLIGDAEPSLEADAAKASFDEDHSLGARSWGKGRHSSIPKSHGADGRNWVD